MRENIRDAGGFTELPWLHSVPPPLLSLARLSSWQTIRHGLSCPPELELEHEHELELELGPHRTLCAGMYAGGGGILQIRRARWVVCGWSRCAHLCCPRLSARFLPLEPLPSPTLPRQCYIFYIKMASYPRREACCFIESCQSSHLQRSFWWGQVPLGLGKVDWYLGQTRRAQMPS